jgi:hypothetical protein
MARVKRCECGCGGLVKPGNRFILYHQGHPKSTLTPMERFLSKVKKYPDGCWRWLAGKDEDGYGIFWVEGKSIRAHRWIFEQTKRRLLKHEQALHNCDVTSCVNPDHTYAGTHLDNMRDMRKRGNGKGIRKSSAWKAKMKISMLGNKNGAKPPKHCAWCAAQLTNRYRKLCDICLVVHRKTAPLLKSKPTSEAARTKLFRNKTRREKELNNAAR